MIIHKIGLVLSIGLLGCNQPNKTIPLSNTEKKPEIAKIKLVDFDGQPIHLETYRGKTVFINFWATWCKPCVEEMPSIERAQAMINDKEVVFLLASSESIEEIKEFNSSHHYKFNYVHLEDDEKLNLQALPTTFIINPKGTLVFSEMGSRNWDKPSNINLIKNIIKQHD